MSEEAEVDEADLRLSLLEGAPLNGINVHIEEDDASVCLVGDRDTLKESLLLAVGAVAEECDMTSTDILDELKETINERDRALSPEGLNE